jgi:hypothetical protein
MAMHKTQPRYRGGRRPGGLIETMNKTAADSVQCHAPPADATRPTRVYELRPLTLIDAVQHNLTSHEADAHASSVIIADD